MIKWNDSSAANRSALKQLGAPRRCAFTLVELLVVIGIIAVLMGILLPTLGKAREQARALKCMSNLRQWAMAINMYCDSNKGSLPYDGDDGDTSGSPVGRADDSALWINALPPQVASRPYYDMQQDDLAGKDRLPIDSDNSLFVCPSADRAVGAGSDVVDAAGYFMMYFVPPTGKGTVMRRTFACYVLNAKLNHTKPVIKLSQLRPGSEAVLFVEKRMQPLEIPASDPNSDKTLGRLKASWIRFTARHRAGGNVAFADGHVAFFTNKEVNAPRTGVINDFNQPGKMIWDPNGPAN